MSEMIGNQFLLAGRFNDAAEQFELALAKHTESDATQTGLQMKLVICYTMGERLKKAVALAADLLERHPQARLRLDEHMSTSCREAAQELKSRESRLTPSVFHASLGVLGLFCDQSRALQELNQALNDDPLLGEVHRLSHLVERHLEAGHV